MGAFYGTLIALFAPRIEEDLICGKTLVISVGLKKRKGEEDPRFSCGATGTNNLRGRTRSVGTSMGVRQKLMRHAQIATTMNVYGDAMMESKRAANSKIVQMALRPALREAK